eukprot:Nk52_evm8s159 gene=Nk52_evmTU8s159
MQGFAEHVSNMSGVSVQVFVALSAILLALFMSSAFRVLRFCLFMGAFVACSLQFYTHAPTVMVTPNAFCCLPATTPPHNLYLLSLLAGLVGGLCSLLAVKAIVCLTGAVFGVGLLGLVLASPLGSVPLANADDSLLLCLFLAAALVGALFAVTFEDFFFTVLFLLGGLLITLYFLDFIGYFGSGGIFNAGNGKIASPLSEEIIASIQGRLPNHSLVLESRHRVLKALEAHFPTQNIKEYLILASRLFRF